MDDPSSVSLAPTAGNERIEALDVVRGFALIGICIMNVEYFNRAIADLGRGINPALTGPDFVISFITQYFVTGVISRRQAEARGSSARSKARARRNASAVAASTSSAMSASTCCITG